MEAPLHQVTTGLVLPVAAAEPSASRYRLWWDSAANSELPAHITLLFPFLPIAEITDTVIDQLTDFFAQCPALSIALTGVGRFDHIAYLAPEPVVPIVGMIEALATTWDIQPYGGNFSSIIPHVTLLQTPNELLLDRVADELGPSLPIDTHIDQAWLIGPDRELSWQIAARFPLGGQVAKSPV